MKTIGILGGMGPEATADLYMQIVRKFQQDFGAKYDRDFPQIIINSIPLPDIVESCEDGIVDMLIKGVKTLELAGADFIVIACNSVQIFLREMSAAVNIPILNLAGETMAIVKEKRYHKIGILATKMSIDNNLFYSKEVAVLLPLQQTNVTEIIMDTLAGKKRNECKIKQILNELKDAGAQAIILACTELPLVISSKDTNLELINTTEVLANATVRECSQKYINNKLRGK